MPCLSHNHSSWQLNVDFMDRMEHLQNFNFSYVSMCITIVEDNYAEDAHSQSQPEMDTKTYLV